MDVDQIFAIQRAKERKLSAARRWVALGGAGGETMYESLSALGLTANLRLCLDAADFQSWPGSGQKWLDRSGGGYDFFRGADGSATTTDPTFNGSYGGLSSSEYWSFDGGDYFTYDTTNEAWMNALHKASAAFTIAAWVWGGGSGSNNIFATSQGNAAQVGVVFVASTSTNSVGINVFNGTGVTSKSISFGGAGYVANAWNFVCIRVDEAANSARILRNGSDSGALTATYTTPSSSASTFNAVIGAAGAGGSPLPNGSRLGSMMIWDRALSQAEMLNLFNRTRSRFGV